jgi:Leucine-rich repeat (LRR) protein
MESARIKSVPKPQIQLGEVQESGIKMRTIPAVIRKIPIPPCLGDLTRLEVLYLANNGLTGPLPPTLGKLRALKGLHLHGNEGLQPPLPLALKELLGGVKHLTLPLALQQALGKKEA